jgi:hypothetical protein
LATKTLSASSAIAAPAGTMSAIALPRDVTRTGSPRPTTLSVSLKDAFSSRIPTTRM